MRPLISYYGGKQRLASKLVPLIPKHTVYCEPFAGGAALLFAKPWPAVVGKGYYREVLNDTCDDLINLYRQAQEQPEALFHLLSMTPYSEAEHRRSAAILRRQVDASPLQLAWAYYVNLQMSFANTKLGGWKRSVFGCNQAATWHTRDPWAPMERLRGTHICNTDALKCIKQWDAPQTFFYCDPPYPGADQGHYAGYTAEDFHALVDTLDACQGSFLLSCYDVPDVCIPAGWQRHQFAAHCTASSNGRVGADRSRKATAAELGERRRAEVVYARANRVPVRPEIAKLYASGAYDCFTGLAPLLVKEAA